MHVHIFDRVRQFTLTLDMIDIFRLVHLQNFERIRLYYLSISDCYRTLYILLRQKFQYTKQKYQSYPKSTKIDAFEQIIGIYLDPI